MPVIRGDMALVPARCLLHDGAVQVEAAMWRVIGLVLLAGVGAAVIYPKQARLGAQVLGGLVVAPSVPEAAAWGR
ncbi:MAG TPA: hypothetical protein PLH11_12375, partial [Gemmobacter sp.]|nr:hypothetical protein [Gemmobacter sp.]